MKDSPKPGTKAFRDEHAAKRREKIEEMVRELESVSFKQLEEALGVELKWARQYKRGAPVTVKPENVPTR